MIRLLAISLGSCFLFSAVTRAQAPAQDQAVSKIEAIGGRVYRDSAGQVDMIDLKGPQVSDEHLALLQSFPALRQLSLDGSLVTDQGLNQLLKLPNLEEVSLLKTKVTPAAAQRFKDQHPKVFHVALSSGLSPQSIVAGAVVLSLIFAWGVALMTLTFRKRDVLTQRQFAQGVGYGLLLMGGAVILAIVASLKQFGVAFD